jgi:hypothetical protein
MEKHRPARPTFSLRFEDDRTRELLRTVANHERVSMNRLAEQMIQRELEVMALGIEDSLSRTMQLLRNYRGQGRREAWEAFAQGEGLPDPVSARRARPSEIEKDDPYGVARAFEAGS